MNLFKNVGIFALRKSDFELIHAARPIATSLFQNASFSFNFSPKANLNQFQCVKPGKETSFYQASRHCSTISTNSEIPAKNLSKFEKVKSLMETEVPYFFRNRIEYRAYAKDVVLENLFDPAKPRITKGINAYAISVMKARIYMNFCYPCIKVSVLESHINERDNTVDILWNLDILSTSSLLRIKSVFPRKIVNKASKLVKNINGISTFHLNEDGLIDKHILRRISDV